MAEQLELKIKLPSISGESPTFPITFASFPVFVPVLNRSAMDTKSWDSTTENVYACEGGTMQRIGPGLNMYDEDTLIALMHLARQYRHEGNPNNFPIPVAPSPGYAKESVIVGVVTAWEVNKYLGRADSGQALQDTRKSIKRLALTQLIFLNDSGLETKCEFFKYTDENRNDLKGRILIQFDPRVTEFLASYISFNLELRMSLTNIGKAVYRYMSTHPVGVELSISLPDLAEAVAHQGTLADFRAALMGKGKRPAELGKMLNHNFLSRYELSGRGRKACLNYERIVL